MNTEKAKPGDTIEMIKVSDGGQKTYTVVEPPDRCSDFELTWVLHHNWGEVHISNPSKYKIIKRKSDTDIGSSNPVGVCKECHGTGKVTLLRFTVDCKCVNEST